MKVVLKKWGNNAAVRLPAAIVKAARLQLDQPLEVRAEHGRVIIEPVHQEPHDVDIDAICAALDPAEKPDLVDFGPPRGSEVW
jgi:antitoxin MazE